MLDSDSYRELGNGKRYKTGSDRTMSENASVEDNRAGHSAENTEQEVPKIRTLTQEAVNEQIKGFIAPLTNQLKELTRLVQEMVKTPNPNHYRRIDCRTICGTAANQPDNRPLIEMDRTEETVHLYSPTAIDGPLLELLDVL